MSGTPFDTITDRRARCWKCNRAGVCRPECRMEIGPMCAGCYRFVSQLSPERVVAEIQKAYDRDEEAAIADTLAQQCRRRAAIEPAESG